MNWGALLVLAVIFFVLMFIIQRTERSKRRFVAVIMVIGAELTRRYLWYRDWPTEGFWAFILALFLNFIFWFIIGRYNPPTSSDEIKVLGND